MATIGSNGIDRARRRSWRRDITEAAWYAVIVALVFAVFDLIVGSGLESRRLITILCVALFAYLFGLRSAR